jgi:hypothetical protein
MMIGVFILGLGVSAYALAGDVRRRRASQVRLLPVEIHLVAAMIAGAGAGLAWGSLWGLVAFILQAAAGMSAAIKLRA